MTIEVIEQPPGQPEESVPLNCQEPTPVSQIEWGPLTEFIVTQEELDEVRSVFLHDCHSE